MRIEARDPIEAALRAVAPAALVALLACSGEPKKDVAIPVDTLTRAPVDTSVLTVDGPGRAATAGPVADADARADADAAPRPARRAIAGDADGRATDRDTDRDTDRKDSDRKKGKGKRKEKKSR